MEQVKDKVIYEDGTEKEVIVRRLNFTERNMIISNYLDIKTYMKLQQEENKDNSNILDCIKDGELFNFIEAVLSKGIKDLELSKLTPEDGDRLFNAHIDYILGGGSKN